MPFNLNLLGENMVSDLLSILTNIGSSPKHALIPYHTHCKIINCNTMVLPAHHLWSHVSWCSRCILCILRIPYSCNSKVCESQNSILIEDQILRFDVPMNNSFLMNVFKGKDHASDEKLGLVLSKSSVSSNMVPEITSTEEIHD